MRAALQVYSPGEGGSNQSKRSPMIQSPKGAVEDLKRTAPALISLPPRGE